MDLWKKFWLCKDSGFIVAASISGGVGFVLIGLWALQVHNILALVFDLCGIATCDASYRLMGGEIDEPRFGINAILLAVVSWLCPLIAVALLVFVPLVGG